MTHTWTFPGASPCINVLVKILPGFYHILLMTPHEVRRTQCCALVWVSLEIEVLLPVSHN